MLYRAFYTNRQKTRSYNAAVLRGKILSGNFNVEKMLDGARNGAVVKMNGSLIYEKKISLDGIPGREFSANLPDRFIMTERVYIRPKSNIVTIYQFSTLYYPESKDAKIDEAFFDSAVITQ